MLRRILLAATLVLGLAPALAQAPPPVPALPDSERLTAYAITSSTCACAVGFQIYGDGTDYQNWVQVSINGNAVAFNDPTKGWTISSPTGPLSSIPRPITDAVLTFNQVQTGTVQIIGDRRPRRLSQFPENRGVAARDFNLVLTDIIAQNREVWDKFNNVLPFVNIPFTTGLPLIGTGPNSIGQGTISGNTTNFLTGVGSFTNGHCAGFDANGNIIDEGGPCTTGGGGGTVTAGSAGQGAYYPGSAATVAGAGPGTTATFGGITASGTVDASGGGFIASGTDLNAANKTSDHALAAFINTVTSAGNATGFIDENGVESTVVATNGFNWYGGGTNAKSTFLPLNLLGQYNAAGQRFSLGYSTTCYGMGDCFGESKQVTFASADINGDEGQGFASVSQLSQQTHLGIYTVTSVTRTTCNTTLTQPVTGGPNAQAVTVASTTGCNANDWVVLDQQLPTGSPNIEAVQIISVGVGSITAIIHTNQTNGTTVTPATVIGLNSGDELGQQRVFVNLSGTTYNTGTVSSISGGGFVGSGTNWTTGMVGGSATNVGCVTLAADDYSSSPFGGGNTLHSWYQILSVASTTSIGIFTFSTAGDGSYHGAGPGAGTYKIQPCVAALRVFPSTNLVPTGTIIAETTSTTWAVGDTVEEIIPPYPDVTAFNYYVGVYTRGGAGLRNFMQVLNVGARAGGTGIAILPAGPIGNFAGADTIAFNTGINLENMGIGLRIYLAQNYGIGLTTALNTGGTDYGGSINWTAGVNHKVLSLNPNSSNGGFDWYMTNDNADPRGLLQTKNVAGMGSGTSTSLIWNGVIGTVPSLFSALPTCAAGLEGLERSITDGSVNTFGSVVVGSGANHVKARCNGTNWVVD